MVGHKFAHGASGKGSNFRTDGKELISYNTLVGYNTGRGLVFLSASSMSPSTGRQLSHARSACSHLDVVYTPIFTYGGRGFSFDEKQAFNLACNALSVQLEGFSKARLGKYLASSINHALQKTVELNDLATKYGFDQFEFFEFPNDKLNTARLHAELWDSRDAARREQARIKEHARQAAQREHDAKEFHLWQRGLVVRCPSSYRYDADGGYYIAVHGDKVVTSGGAECPRLHAARAIEFWFSRHMLWFEDGNKFDPWHRNGHRVQLGTFQLDRIEADGTAYAGCHKFTRAELDRLADILL